MATKAEQVQTLLKRDSYYRSQLYTSYTGINPLITAAHPLFSAIDRIRFNPTHIDVDIAYEQIQHELRAFEARITTEEYEKETIVISRYLLSLLFDEAITINTKQKQKKKLAPPTKDKHSLQDSFVDILKSLIDKPNNYQDLLEFIYLCLSTSFRENGALRHHEELFKLTEKLYQTIAPLQEKTDKPLFSSMRYTINNQQFPWYSLILIGACFVGFSYFAINYLLDNTVKNLLPSTTIREKY